MARSGRSRSLGGSGLRRIAWAFAALSLTAIFVVQGFPYERLAAAISAAVGRNSPLQLSIQELGPSLTLLGPGLRATSMRISAPDGPAIRLDALRLRPAWSLRWLRLRPSFQIETQLAGGSVDGTLGGEPSFTGELAEIDLGQLPVAALWPGSALTGRTSGSVDLRAGAQGPEGSVALEARDGSVTLPGLPALLPFETLTARLALGGDASLRVEELHLSGPGLEAQVLGQLGLAATLAQAPLDLRVELEVERGLAAGLQSLGVRLGRDGRGTLHITGTPDRPVVE
jgi:type II secretion system protein N